MNNHDYLTDKGFNAPMSSLYVSVKLALREVESEMREEVNGILGSINQLLIE